MGGSMLTSLTRIFPAPLLAALCVLPVPAAAQYIGGNAPPPPAAPLAGQRETPEAALARNIRLIAINPKDYEALVGAGRAALLLGDAQAAIGFFGRAEEVHPVSWVPKAGQATALVQMMEPQAALGYFAEAQRLGASQSAIALDRGLAFDLSGNQSSAQNDYRAVLNGVDPNEARRRLAVSLAIAGNRAEALSTLDPLLARRDPAAMRLRAFILALTGDTAGARAAVQAAMPSLAGSMEPFLRRLATLRAGEKVAAVHFGVMPPDGAQLATLNTPAPPAIEPAPLARSSPPVLTPTPDRAPVRVAVLEPRVDRLADIESALVKLPERPAEAPRTAPPPPPRPIIERPVARKAVVAGEALKESKKPSSSTTKLAQADPERAKGRKTARGRKDGKEDEAAKPASSSRGRIWVQLAGGAFADRMPTEFARIRAKKPSLFAKRVAHVADLKGWSRLLVGPFKTDEEAQDFVNDLHKAGLQGFAWTSPSGQNIEKLASR